MMGRKRKNTNGEHCDTSVKTPRVSRDDTRVEKMRRTISETKASTQGENSAGCDSRKSVTRGVKPKKSQGDSVLLAHSKKTWSKHEKEQLLSALKQYEPDDYENIGRCVASRSTAEVKWYIENVRHSNVPLASSKKVHAPIEQWLSAAENLCRLRVDYSVLLSQIMDIAGKYEPKILSQSDLKPDYTNIYIYIGQLLEGDFVDVSLLSPVDAVIVLDLLEGLAENLKTLDLKEQCNLMAAKHRLLNTKVSPDNPFEAHRNAARALQEDIFESEASDEVEAAASVSQPDSTEDKSLHRTETACNLEPSPSTSSHSEKSRRHMFDKKLLTATNKSILYTLNPFAIGVSYLNPRKKGAAEQNMAEGNTSS